MIHISQALLGEVKDVKGDKHVPLRVKIDDKNFIIGSLPAELRPQVMFDLVFEREFELSHYWKNGSIYFLGYVADDPVSEDDELSSSDDQSENELQLEAGVVAKAEAGAVKPAEKAAAAKAATKAKRDDEQDSDENDDDDDDSESGFDDEMNLDGILEMDSDDEDVYVLK